jgi:glycosyltransferase involved in cell wall biosynthesis
LTQNRRISHLLVIAPERSASLALVASYPFAELETQDVLKLRIRTASEASARDLSWCDIVFAVRPANAAMAALVIEAKRMKRIVMCHWDDDLLSIPKESSSYAYFARPGVRSMTLATLLLADVVLSSSANLALHLRTVLDRNGKSQTPTLLLPVPALNINTSPYHSTKLLNTPTHYTVGYAGSADQSVILQKLIIPALETLWHQGQEIELQLMGPRLQIDQQWQRFVTTIPTTPNYEQWLNLRNGLKWDAALAPLAEGQFNRCKFPNKYLEFSAAGIPCVFSDVEPFNTIISHKKNGLLVKNSIADWAAAIQALHNPAVATTIASSALASVSQNNNLQKVSAEIKSLLLPWLTYYAPVNQVSRNLIIRKKMKWLHTNMLRRYL